MPPVATNVPGLATSNGLVTRMVTPCGLVAAAGIASPVSSSSALSDIVRDLPIICLLWSWGRSNFNARVDGTYQTLDDPSYRSSFTTAPVCTEPAIRLGRRRGQWKSGGAADRADRGRGRGPERSSGGDGGRELSGRSTAVRSGPGAVRRVGRRRGRWMPAARGRGAAGAPRLPGPDDRVSCG